MKNDIFTELHVEISDTDDLKKAHDVISEIEERIIEEISIISDVKIHIDEPSELFYNTTDITNKSKELIRYIKNILDESKDVENYCDIKIITASGKIRVSLNCEFDHSLSFDEVHDHVTLLESKIYLSLKELYSNLSNVIIHAEPKDSA
jgi:divalent metal cation (Fe/Co/Zn/Cd) transporter